MLTVRDAFWERPQIAEWVIGTWLLMSHRLLEYHNFQREARWNKVLYPDITDSPGLRMGILGYGAIGRQVARLASAMGMEIYAYTRSERATPESRRDSSYCVPGTGDPEGLLPAKWFHGSSKEATNQFLSQELDVLVICLPLTEATRCLIGPEQFGILARKKTFVSNIGRGKIVDTSALLEAVEQGKIRGRPSMLPTLSRSPMGIRSGGHRTCSSLLTSAGRRLISGSGSWPSWRQISRESTTGRRW